MRVTVDRHLKRFFDNPAVVPLAMLVLVVVGGILRLWLARQDLFADELATYWVVSTRGLWGVVETVSTTAEITPPLSFVLSWLTSRIGLSPELVRLPALVAGIGSIPLVYLVGIRTVGRGAALLAAALTTLSPFMIFYSAEARGYGVLMALVLLSTLTLLVAVEDGRRRWWVAYGAFVCLAAYTHYTAVFVLAAQFGWAFWVHPRTRRPLLIATFAAVVLYLPWLPSLKGDIDSPTTDILSFLSPFDLESVRVALGQLERRLPVSAGRADARWVTCPGSWRWCCWPASICVGALRARHDAVAARAVVRRQRPAASSWSSLLALATPVGTALQSALGTNVFSTRSLAASWPYLALAVAALITVGTAARCGSPPRRWRSPPSGSRRGQMASTDFQRPDYSRLAQLAEAPWRRGRRRRRTSRPGPLTNFDVEGSSPGVEVFRLTVPEQMTTPFTLVRAAAGPG